MAQRHRRDLLSVCTSCKAEFSHAIMTLPAVVATFLASVMRGWHLARLELTWIVYRCFEGSVGRLANKTTPVLVSRDESQLRQRRPCVQPARASHER